MYYSTVECHCGNAKDGNTTYLNADIGGMQAAA